MEKWESRRRLGFETSYGTCLGLDQWKVTAADVADVMSVIAAFVGNGGVIAVVMDRRRTMMMMLVVNVVVVDVRSLMSVVVVVADVIGMMDVVVPR